MKGDTNSCPSGVFLAGKLMLSSPPLSRKTKEVTFEHLQEHNNYIKAMDKPSEGTGLDDNFMGIFIKLCRNCLRFIKDLLSLVVGMRLADFNWGYNLRHKQS